MSPDNIGGSYNTTNMLNKERCPTGTRKKNGVCKPGSMKLVNGILKWVFDPVLALAPALSNPKQSPIKHNKTLKGDRKRCPNGQKEVIESGVKWCVKRDDNIVQTIKKSPEPVAKAAKVVKAPIGIDELRERVNTNTNLYPFLTDPEFNRKIADKQEFRDLWMTDTKTSPENFRENVERSCTADFEILPHQKFVKNFLSQQTPYNSLLLYHGLGTGKTCSAIGIAEEMRTYLRQLGIRQKILILAQPNVRDNFRRQLFDETKLKQVKRNGEVSWNIQSCVGNTFLKEINPSLNGLIKPDDIVNKVKRLINRYYEFSGYGELANLIDRMRSIDDEADDAADANDATSVADANDATIVPLTGELYDRRIKQEFNNRLIIIDEVHNIRISNDPIGAQGTKAQQKRSKVGLLLQYIARIATNVRFVLLSATPIYNSNHEIILLTNLMNINDHRAPIKQSDVFDAHGNFVKGGRELLSRKLTGYVSFVRGENPYTFPYRIYPRDIPALAPYSILSRPYPTKQLNSKRLPTGSGIQMVDLFMSKISATQMLGYQKYLRSIPTDTSDDISMQSQTFGYQVIKKPLQALNIVFPAERELVDGKKEPNEIDYFLGSKGLSKIMDVIPNPTLHFRYKKTPYAGLFSPAELPKYSSKINTICQMVAASKGIVLVFAEYIWGGIVSIALALEELGFNRHKRPNLLTAKASKPIGNYIMITGKAEISPNNAQEIKEASLESNKHGDQIKVVLISVAGSEGIDFKCIKQIHILDPWFTLSRVEQIIGRGVRNSSHCYLPIEERCVELYLHATELSDPEQESADLYLYRYAENKAIQIGKTNRLLKEISVDCILNDAQKRMTVEDLNTVLPLRLSNGSTIQYPVGDKAHTNLCDYMSSCTYQCIPEGTKETVTNSLRLTNEYLRDNSQLVIEKIKTIFQKNRQVSYTIPELQAKFGGTVPINILYFALTALINNQFETLIDANGRHGRLINRGEYYLFQPMEITDKRANVYERLVTPDYKPKAVLFEIPKTLTKPAAEVTEDADDDIDELTDFIEEQIGKMFTAAEPTGQKTKEWPIAFNIVSEEMQHRFGFSIKELREAGINHLLNTLSLKQKLALLANEADLEPHIRAFIESKRLGNSFAILYDKDTGTNQYLYLDPSTKEWTPKEQQGWENRIKQQAKPFEEYVRRQKRRENNRVDYGFMVTFAKSKEVIFKFKRYGDAGNGLYVANGNRSDAVLIVNNVLKQLGYDYAYPTTTKVTANRFDVLQLSVILELLLRKHGRFFEPE
jgi:hypothetical protein